MSPCVAGPFQESEPLKREVWVMTESGMESSKGCVEIDRSFQRIS